MHNVYKISKIEDYYELGDVIGEGGSAVVKIAIDK